MSFTAAIKYVSLLDPSSFEIQDISNYASPDDKANISSRTLTILRADDTALPGYTNPIAFPYGGGDTILFTGLTADVALKITMTLVPVVSHGGSVYVAEADIATTRFLQLGLYNIQVQENNSPVISNAAIAQYRQSSIDIIIETQNSQTALLYTDFTASQEALNRGQNIINNTQL